ncbi:hypothetical protein MJO28_008206 [Puccinia striiformis f. sp. tritici]|uniref:Uncharacterized protein n=1 Tax=Puccinia striiformis f. sp. tritici TaxID=168172 RepID=A0ACC0EBW1_9BASI|nr:hypothetical protein MJO28_008206 [Puccinia striiformis f. sp. tritici]
MSLGRELSSTLDLFTAKTPSNLSIKQRSTMLTNGTMNFSMTTFQDRSTTNESNISTRGRLSTPTSSIL